MTDLEIINKVEAHLLAQGRRATNFDTCVYKSANGSKCAVGCLFTDEEYSPKMEGHGVGGLYEASLLPSRLIPHLSLLIQLQVIHDRSLPEQWSSKLAELRRMYE